MPALQVHAGNGRCCNRIGRRMPNKNSSEMKKIVKTIVKMLLIKHGYHDRMGLLRACEWLKSLPMRKRPLALWLLIHMGRNGVVEPVWKLLND